MTDHNADIVDLVERISPWDELEKTHQDEVLSWLRSGMPIYRTAPDVPKRHLVSYFVVIDEMRDELLLVAHRKAGLWLPTGGHVEVDEHPWQTVVRECGEELRIAASPSAAVGNRPLFVTVTATRGVRPHTDVSLWFVVSADRTEVNWYDAAEFSDVRWLSIGAVRGEPPDHLDPHLHRFAAKLKSVLV